MVNPTAVPSALHPAKQIIVQLFWPDQASVVCPWIALIEAVNFQRKRCQLKLAGFIF
jgi:hypothetical protein